MMKASLLLKLTASEQELAIIQRDLIGIPKIRKRSHPPDMTWYGDDAKFIWNFFLDYHANSWVLD